MAFFGVKREGCHEGCQSAGRGLALFGFWGGNEGVGETTESTESTDGAERAAMYMPLIPADFTCQITTEQDAYKQTASLTHKILIPPMLHDMPMICAGIGELFARSNEGATSYFGPIGGHLRAEKLLNDIVAERDYRITDYGCRLIELKQAEFICNVASCQF